jgi:putative ABC transport system permease protein
MSSLWLDLRYALRMMARTPGLTAVVVVTLALGIGASTTIFSVVNAVVLRPLPYAEPDRLVSLYSEIPGRAAQPRGRMSTGAYHDLKASCRTCAAVAAWRPTQVSLSGGERPVRVSAAWATDTLAPVLGVRPVIGRWFEPAEVIPNTPTLIVLGFDLWQRVFGGDPGILGRRIHDGARPLIVIGVMPRGFRFPEDVDAWLPGSWSDQLNDFTGFAVGITARIAPDASLAALRDELAVQTRSWNARGNAVYAAHGMAPVVLQSHATLLLADTLGSLATTLWLLQGAVMFVLLISVVNVANLMLARAETRTREVAVRHALGASRRRLVRQFVTESLVLGLGGGGLGVLIAMWAIDGVTALIPDGAPRSGEIALDGASVVFAAACSVLAALVFGLAPSVHARRADLHGALKDGSPQVTGGKARLAVRRALVISEISLAVVLVVGCTAMVRSFLRLQRVDLGFAPDHMLTLGVELPRGVYPPAATAFWQRFEDRLRALPGVRSATLLCDRPASAESGARPIALPGRTLGGPGEPDWLVDYSQCASGDLVEALGARLIRGRPLTRDDGVDAPLVALVNETFAAKLFHGRDPIGQRVKLMAQETEPEVTVVGVIGDLKLGPVEEPAGAQVIGSLWQLPRWTDSPPRTPREMFAVLRTTDQPGALIPAVSRAVAEIDPALPVFDLRTMDDVLWTAVARPRFLLFLLSAFAGIALVLAAIGVYGVMAHTVAQRTHEIGLRVALGAQPSQVRAMVLRRAATLVIAGVAAGLAATIALAEALGPSLRSMLYDEQIAHPALLAGVALTVTVTALVATWIPARRATRVEPTVALRSE